MDANITLDIKQEQQGERTMKRGPSTLITRKNLQNEIRKRKLSEVEYAAQIGVSYTWLRRILMGEDPSNDLRVRMRDSLKSCHVCGHQMTVPKESVLFKVEGKVDDADHEDDEQQ